VNAAPVLHQEHCRIFLYLIVFDRRVTPMKWFFAGLGAALCCFAVFATMGCGPDNETEAERLAKTAGDPGPANPKSKVGVAPPATGTGQEDWFKQKGNQYKDTGYPGAAKQK
jgi:hypothetical protein